MTPATAAIPLLTARARRAAAPTTPIPAGTAPALPLRYAITTAPEEVLNRWGRRLVLTLALGLAAIAGAVLVS